MMVEFVIGRHPTGELIISQFEASIKYEVQPFEFIVRPFRDAENFKQILEQFAAIDDIKLVYLKGCTTLPWYRPAQPTLNGLVLLGSQDSVSWSICFGKQRHRELERIIFENHLSLESLLLVAGTIRAILPELKERKRQEVREAAIRRARIMRDNAAAILAFLAPDKN